MYWLGSVIGESPINWTLEDFWAVVEGSPIMCICKFSFDDDIVTFNVGNITCYF